jgi:hypothetical protein
MSLDLTIDGSTEETALVEVEPSAVISLLGATFKVAPKLGLMPLLRFAHLSSKGVTADDMDALSAMYDLLRGVIDDSDWDAFQQHAAVVRADENDLLEAVRGAIEAMSARPTVRPSDSSDGPPLTGTSLSEDSSATGSSTPASDTLSANVAPIMRDPRVRELLPLSEAARRVG